MWKSISQVTPAHLQAQSQGHSKAPGKMLTSDDLSTPSISGRTPLGELLGEGECLMLVQDLEQRLRNQIDKIEHLKLSVAEALSNSSNNTGFKSIEQHGGDLKMSMAEHTAFLNDLNKRTESLQMSISLYIQVKTLPKVWCSRRSIRRRRQLVDDTQSELGWNPAWPRRNSNSSEMSCAW
ncbi:Hypothetical predicted protein [Pelobates cultripes]|uniref:Uncharacterized protein n=1 Tax=Pelobates cultripes TaxID=61616 RepID=A0AAD1T438_PELCU|nr:Hypothetical predicted protein [Pelobates cultripes]